MPSIHQLFYFPPHICTHTFWGAWTSPVVWTTLIKTLRLCKQCICVDVDSVAGRVPLEVSQLLLLLQRSEAAPAVRSLEARLIPGTEIQHFSASAARFWSFFLKSICLSPNLITLAPHKQLCATNKPKLLLEVSSSWVCQWKCYRSCHCHYLRLTYTRPKKQIGSISDYIRYWMTSAPNGSIT